MTERAEKKRLRRRRQKQKALEHKIAHGKQLYLSGRIPNLRNDCGNVSLAKNPVEFTFPE